MKYILVRVDDPMRRWEPDNQLDGYGLAKIVKSLLNGYGPGIATVDVTDDIVDVENDVVDVERCDGWVLDTSPPWRCEAVTSHGPGHQSTTRCERKTEHPIEGEHYAMDPMCGTFEWVGAKGVEPY